MMLDSAGIYTGDEDASDQDLFVVERKTFKSLCSGLVQQCGCLSNPSWTIASFIKLGSSLFAHTASSHVSGLVPECCLVITLLIRNWSMLSPVLACCPRQYMNFYLFAGMGVVKQKNISSVYQNKLYQQVVADVAEESMKAAVERVKESPHRATSGETAAQSCSDQGGGMHKIVLPQVIARGLNITKVAHDSGYYKAVCTTTGELIGVIAGTKNVGKQLRHICAGTGIGRGSLNFLIRGDHQSCYSESPCQQPGYVPQRKPLTMPAAISAYEAALRNTLIYKNADSCHLLLTYLPKRILIHTKTFEMRINLAVMDWNENCQRMATSHHEYTDVRRPDHHSTYNVLVKKTYRFVQNIWSMYVLRNITSQQILQDDEDDDDDMVLPYDAAMYDGDYVDSEDDDYVCSEDGGDDEEEDN
eukprot:Em0001g2967a